MTLYYTLVFALLVAEMGLFVGIVLPMPFTVRRKLFTYDSYATQTEALLTQN
jgi:B-cell receptor-associated protein 31